MMYPGSPSWAPGLAIKDLLHRQVAEMNRASCGRPGKVEDGYGAVALRPEIREHRFCRDKLTLLVVIHRSV